MKTTYKACTIILIALLAVGILVSINPIKADGDFTVSEASFPGQMAASCCASNGTLFAGDIDNHLYRSNDNGSNYESVYNFSAVAEPDTGLDGYMVMVYVDSRDYVFVSIPATNALFRSTDWGVTFNEVLNANGTLNDGLFLGFTEDDQGDLYASMYCNSVYPSLPQLLKSTDGGATWTNILTIQAIHFHSIAFNPYNNYLYACTGEDATPYTPLAYNQDAESIFRSTDYGANWTKIVNHHVAGGYGNSTYFPIEFIGNDVYLGTDFGIAGSQPLNGVDHFYDDGSNSFMPERVYTFPDDGQCPVVSSSHLNDTMIFSTTTEFYDGTTRVIASADGSNWETLRSAESTVSLHHANILTQKPHGVIFASHSDTVAYKIYASEEQSSMLFEDGFESGDFSSWTTSGGSGEHSETVETTNPHCDTYNLEVSAETYHEGWVQKDITPSPVVYFQQYIELTDLPTSGNRIYLGTIQSENSNNNVDVFVENLGGQIYWGAYSSISGTPYHDREATPSNPQTGVYYCVETCRDTVNGLSQLWIDGNLRVSASRAHVGNANHIYSGISWTMIPTTIHVDCIKVSTEYIEPESEPEPTPTPSPTPTPDAPLVDISTVRANVTVTGFSYASDTLNVTVVKDGTNYIQADINKDVLTNVENLTVYINSTEESFTYVDNSSYWTINVLAD